MPKLWKANVQADKKPYQFQKTELLAELDETSARKLYEKAMKHPHVNLYILWMCVADEKKYGVPAKTYIYLEGFIF